VPGQMSYELVPPDGEGKWYFRATGEISLAFSETADGQIEALTMYQAGREYYMPQTESASLPTVAEIMALRDAEGNRKALEAMGNYSMETSSYYEQSGVTGKVTMYVAGPDKYRIEVDYGKYGYSRLVLNGEGASVESSFGPFQKLHGKLLAQARLEHPYVLFGDWRDYFDSIKVSGADTYHEKNVFIIELKSGDLPTITLLVDSKTGDILLSQATVLQEGGIGILITVTYEDFHEVHGIRMAARSISTNEQTGRTITSEEAMEISLQFDEALFSLEPSIE